MSYTVLQGQDLVDVALATTGTQDAVVALARLNGLAVDAVLAADQVLETVRFDQVLIVDAPTREPVADKVQHVTVLQRQNLVDVVLEHAGKVDELVAVARLNGIAIDAELEAGQMLLVPVRLASSAFVQALRARGQHVATGTELDPLPEFNDDFNYDYLA